MKTSYLDPIVSEYNKLEPIAARLAEISKELEDCESQLPSLSDGDLSSGDDGTGIVNVLNEEEEIMVYTLSGMGQTMKKEDLKSLPKGTYIVNGKKVMLK